MENKSNSKDYCEACQCCYNSDCQSYNNFLNQAISLRNSQNRLPNANDTKKSHSISKTALKTVVSDSKIITNITSCSKFKEIDNNKTDNVQQLKQDLKTIKEQLFFLSKNRNEALNITDELQVRFKYLSEKNKEYKRKIKKLKTKNCQLEKQLEKNEELKRNKINLLYQEFLEATSNANDSQKCPCFLNAAKPEEKLLENNLQVEICQQCNQHLKDIQNNCEHYQHLYEKYQKINGKVKMLKTCDQQRLAELQHLKLSERYLLDQLEQLQRFIADLTTTNNKNNVTIADLNDELCSKETIMQELKADNTTKEPRLNLLLTNEQSLKQQMSQIEKDQIQRKSSNDSQMYSCVLGEDFQDLISALYQEVYKTMAKEAIIQQQNRDIRSLQCALSCKERIMMDTQNELNMLRGNCLCNNK